MTTLLVGHALADGAPLGPTLREAGEPGAAREAEAGELSACLERLGFDAELVAMASLWPAALPLARQRLSALPAPLIAQLPMAQTLGYLTLVGLLQVVVLVMLQVKVMPMLVVLGAADDAVLLGATVGLVVLGAGLGVGLAVWARRGGWRVHRERARQAALAAAMAAAGAPMSARQALGRQLTALADPGADAADLARITDHALACAEQAHRRAVAAVRLVGIGGLVAIGGTILASTYRTLALLSVPL